MLGKSWHWSKRVFLCFLPAYPLAHLVINGYRVESPISWMYIKRLNYPIPDHLSEIVESELENLDDLSKADLFVTLTDKLDARSYGGFYLRPAVEMQIPLRAAIRDLEEAARLGASIEIDTGIASGKALCVPIFLWLGTFGVSFVFLNIATHLLGPIAAFSLSTVTAFTAFYTFHRRFIAFLEQKLDITTCKKSDVYIDGARDFLKSTMTLNRLLRSTMGADGEKCIAENGDRIGDQLPYSKRLRIVEQLNRERNFDIKRDLENYDA
ncbi:unnamed protein product [Toxocara canis]|uniref:Transmembrane protein n=1 Tax=Toxocara canis TaxID=6265 RepID=A0A183V7T6_TOXCA|nr:unnamed protein product [Toxocara canis]